MANELLLGISQCYHVGPEGPDSGMEGVVWSRGNGNNAVEVIFLVQLVSVIKEWPIETHIVGLYNKMCTLLYYFLKLLLFEVAVDTCKVQHQYSILDLSDIINQSSGKVLFPFLCY